MLLVWDENAWEDYLWWQAQDRRVLKRVNALLVDIQCNGNEGIGKPEALDRVRRLRWKEDVKPIRPPTQLGPAGKPVNRPKSTEVDSVRYYPHIVPSHKCGEDLL